MEMRGQRCCLDVKLEGDRVRYLCELNNKKRVWMSPQYIKTSLIVS